MNAVLFLHILAAFVWLGCVLAESVIERAGDGSEIIRRFVSQAHWRIDLIVEIPAFVIVLLTGAHLAFAFPFTPAIAGMTIAGLVAVGLNLHCVGLVRRRLKAAEAGDYARWLELDHRQHLYGAIVLIAILVALAFGASLFLGG
jgi:hypothetical protein